MRPTQSPVQLVPKLCLGEGVKRPGRGFHHPPPFTTHVETLLPLRVFMVYYVETLHHLIDPSIGGSVTQKWTLGEQSTRMWIGFSLLGVQTSGSTL